MEQKCQLYHTLSESDFTFCDFFHRRGHAGQKMQSVFSRTIADAMRLAAGYRAFRLDTRETRRADTLLLRFLHDLQPPVEAGRTNLPLPPWVCGTSASPMY